MFSLFLPLQPGLLDFLREPPPRQFLDRTHVQDPVMEFRGQEWEIFIDKGSICVDRVSCEEGRCCRIHQHEKRRELSRQPNGKRRRKGRERYISEEHVLRRIPKRVDQPPASYTCSPNMLASNLSILVWPIQKTKSEEDWVSFSQGNSTGFVYLSMLFDTPTLLRRQPISPVN